jgi:CRISPR-associated exonuclease Cas4
MEEIKPMTITGVKVNYYFICKTKLWLFSHNIQMEKEDENVQMGKLIHESRYQREKKEVIIDSAIAIDFIKKGDILEIHDVKKSKKMEDAHRYQLLYYLYYLNKRGVEAIGILNYPLLRKKEVIVPNEKDFDEIEGVIAGIGSIVSGRMPEPKKKRICKRCSYYEFCFGGLDED